jgi:DNA-binding winged helix-turn-helix (wHTH) protein/tetratricopeptide (TPR) repeat protein
MEKQLIQFYEFGPFRLDPAQGILLRNGEPVWLTPKALEILGELVRNRGQIVGRDELIKTVWPDSFIEDNNVTQHVSTLRKTLGEGKNGPPYIETFSKRGYRFIASVREVQKEGLPSQTSEEFCVDETAVPITSIAVLPFRALNGDGEDEHLALGIADAVITKLSNIKQLVVRPTSAILKYVASKEDLMAIGRELRVDSVLHCYFQRVGERIRVTVQLVSVSSGRSVWADKFDENISHIFLLQDSISERATQALVLQLSKKERKLLKKRFTDNTEAYQSYLKGRYYWNKRTEEGLKKSIDHFQHAIELDKNYAAAYAGLADAYSLTGNYSFLPPSESFSKARVAAQRALEIDDTLAEARASLAFVKLEYDWNWSQAETEFNRVIEMNPNYATAHHWYAYYLAAMGRFEQAIAAIKRASQLDPLSLVISTDVGEIFYFSRMYYEVIEQLQSTLEMDSSFVRAHENLGLAYLQKGMLNEAIIELEAAVTISGTVTESQAGFLGHAYAVGGERKKAAQLLSHLKESSKRNHVSRYYIALINIGFGDKENAFVSLEEAFNERPGGLVYMNVEPMFDSLRSDSRFVNLLGRIGLYSHATVTVTEML